MGSEDLGTHTPYDCAGNKHGDEEGAKQLTFVRVQSAISHGGPGLAADAILMSIDGVEHVYLNRDDVLAIARLLLDNVPTEVVSPEWAGKLSSS